MSFWMIYLLAILPSIQAGLMILSTICAVGSFICWIEPGGGQASSCVKRKILKRLILVCAISFILSIFVPGENETAQIKENYSKQSCSGK